MEALLMTNCAGYCAALWNHMEPECLEIAQEYKDAKFYCNLFTF